MESEKAGGFCTGWKGIAITSAYGALAVGLAVTAIFGGENTEVALGRNSISFVNANATDFGAQLYLECMTNSSTYDDGPWQATLEGGLTALELTDLDTMEAYEPDPQFPRFVNRSNSNFIGYRFEPEYICNALCNQLALEKTGDVDDCLEFTYDGIENDQCRFWIRGSPAPGPRVAVDFEEDPHWYIYNNTCMNQVRADFIAAANRPATNLTRPLAFTPVQSAWELPYPNAVLSGFQALRAQWAGTLPSEYDIEWRKEGYAGACGGDGDGGSFYGGDHLVSTMGIAAETGLLALGRLWWRDAYSKVSATALNGGARGQAGDDADMEIFRQAAFLDKAYDAQTGELIIGVGDQELDGTLAAYQSFSSADDALSVGPPETEFGQPTTVAPTCSRTTPAAPAAEVAAHAAAALVFASQVAQNSTVVGPRIAAQWMTTAESLYAYSTRLAPPSTTAQQARGSQLGTDINARHGASQVYPIGEAEYVFAHQFWAACALWQATEDEQYWRQTKLLFEKMRQQAFGSRLFWPVPNYDNPAWYGLMCMAQSAPSYAGLEEDVTFRVDLTVNNTRDELLVDALKYPADDSRSGALNHMWRALISAWLNYDRARLTPVTVTGSGTLRYASYVDDGPQKGLFRDASNVAMLALMFADMPGVTAQRQFWSRCLARQTIDYILGDNPQAFSYMVGVAAEGSNSPVNPYSKDAACPPEEVIADRFERIYVEEGTGRNTTFRFEARTRCDFLTFFGGEPDTEVISEAAGIQREFENPTLNNTWPLDGALVSTFNPTTEVYIDSRNVTTRAGNDTANPHALIDIEFQPGFMNAIMGLISLGEDFWGQSCPGPAQLRAQIARVSATEDI